MKKRDPRNVTLSKISTGALVAFSLLLGKQARATSDASSIPIAPNSAVAAAKPSENQAMGPLLEAVLNNIQKAQLDFEIQGSVESGKDFVSSLLSVSGLLQLKEDVKQDLKIPDTKPAAGASQSSQDKTIAGLIPQLQLGMKGLYVDAKYIEKAGVATASVRFYSGFDKTKNQWTAKPLVASVSNQLNSNLLTVRLHSIDFSKKVDPSNPDRSLLEGSCKSDKQSLDIISGKVLVKPVLCQFSGYLDKDSNYKVNFKYVNQ